MKGTKILLLAVLSIGLAVLGIFFINLPAADPQEASSAGETVEPQALENQAASSDDATLKSTENLLVRLIPLGLFFNLLLICAAFLFRGFR